MNARRLPLRGLLRPGALALLAMLAACSTPPAPPAPARLGSIDGTYTGYAYLTSASSSEESLCGSNIPLSLTVVDRIFIYTLDEPQVTYAPVKRFTVQIQPDGTFQAQAESGSARLQGKQSGRALTGDVFGEACTYHFDTAVPGP